MGDRIDFQAIADAALAQAHVLVPRWLPAGRREGHEWRCGSVRGEAGSSFAVNLTTGVWADFSGDDDRGGDLVSLYAAIFTQNDQGKAARELSRELGMVDRSLAVQPARPAAGGERKTPWQPVLPVPSDAPAAPVAHSVRGRPACAWTYRDALGRMLGVVYRFQTSDGGKEVLPCVWATNPTTGLSEWRWLSFPVPRPLYGLDGLRERKPVLIVEGEKCRDAAQAALGEWFDVISWPGGGKAVSKADWSPLQGRRVIIWPDCDAKRVKGPEPESERPLLPAEKQPGIQAANAIAGILQGLGCLMRMVDIPAPGEKPDGWDVADAIAEGLTGRELFEWIKARLREPDVAQAHDPSPAHVTDGPPPELPSTPDGAGAGERWDARLLRKARGGYEDCKENVAIALEDHPRLAGLLAYNEFSGRIEKRREPPWASQPGEWTEDDDRELSMWLGMRCELLIRATSTVAEGVRIVANRNRYHPVRAWLEGLEWDGHDRLSFWLRDCLGVEDTEYASLVGTLWMRQAVNRIIYPGSKGDYALILEGSQGLRKSTALRRLGGEWYSDAPLDLQSKDAFLALNGVWIYEIAELDAFNRAESTRIKAFMTMNEDRYRPPYGSRYISQPRQTVFAGTTNNDEYHKDPTGNRRFWSVLCHLVDLELIDAWREQLFAQALAEVQEGKPAYPTREEERRLIVPEQERREIVDPWMEYITRWINEPERALTNTFSTGEILAGAIKMTAERMDGQRSAATRVGNCMKKLGWTKRRASIGDARPWVYERPKAAPAAEPASPGGSHLNGAEADVLPL